MDRGRRLWIYNLLPLLLAGVAACKNYSTPTNPSTLQATLSSFTLNPPTVNGGETSTATVTLTEPAPVGGFQVRLFSSNDSTVLPAVALLTIPQGATSGTFKIQTLPVGSTQTAQITVSYLVTVALQATLTIVSTNPLSINAFTANATNVPSGQTIIGTITLNAPAFSPGQQVFIASSDTSVQPQNPVTVPTNSTTVNFSIFTSPISSQRAVTLTATLNTTSVRVQLTLMPTGTAITSLLVVPFTAAGGQSMTGTLTIASPAPSGGVTIALTATFTNPATPAGTPLPVTIPTSVTVPAGATQAQFTIMSFAVTKTTDVTLIATLNTTQGVFTVEIVPSLTLAGINCVPTTLTTGNTEVCSVSLSIPAPLGGQAVQVSSSNTTALPVPATVTVPQGASSQAFSIVAGSPSATSMVTLTASLQGTTTGSVTTTVNVVPVSAISLSGFVLSAAAVQGGAPTVNVINITESSTLATASVPSGYSSLFQVGALFAGSGFNVAGYNSTFQIVGVTSRSITFLAPAALGSAGAGVLTLAVTGTVTISSAAPPGGLVINLSSSDPSAQFPNGPTVTVAPNASSISFPITTTSVLSPVNVTLTATVNSSSVMAMLAVVPPAVLLNPGGLTLNPASLVGGNSGMGTVTLASAAPQGGATVTLQTLQNTGNVVQIAPTVTVAAGSTSANFTVTTLLVATQQIITIQASINGSSQQAMLTIIPPPPDLRLLFFNPPTVATGQTSTGTVTLTAPAPAAGTMVMLTSANSTVVVPASVTVLAGATSATFTAMAATGVTTSTSVQVTGTVTATAMNTLTVIPAPAATFTEQIVTAGETNSTDFPIHLPSGVSPPSLVSGEDTGFLTSIGLSTASGSTTSSFTFSTYLGGMSSFGQVRDVVTDSKGNVFACGVTMDGALSTTANAAQSKYGGGKDAFIAEFDATGALQYLSYLGGSGDETCNSLTVDASGNIFVSGSSSNSTAMGATNLMGTSGAFQTANAGGNDFFVAKINPTGTTATTRLLWLTLVGGAADDFADGRIAINAAGNVLLTGTSQSTAPPPGGFPIAMGQGRPNLLGVGSFGVVLGISSDGTHLLSTTLLFGRVNGANPGTPTTTTASGGIAFNSSGNLYVCGQTNASDLPVSSGAFQTGLKGQQNAYVAILNSNGSITRMTYLGGTSASTVQACKGIAIDSENNVVIAMPTDAADYPVTRTIPGGLTLMGKTHFAVTKLTSDLSTVVFSTLVGGSGSESADATRIVLDSSENLYFSLATTSGDFPVTPNAIQGTFAGTSGGSNTNVAVVKLSADGSTILFGSYLGGTSNNSTTSVFYRLN